MNRRPRGARPDPHAGIAVGGAAAACGNDGSAVQRDRHGGRLIQCDGTTVKTAAADTSGYVDQALKMADDKSIGYSQKHRRLNPDVDCSSFVFYALKKAGYDVATCHSPRPPWTAC